MNHNRNKETNQTEYTLRESHADRFWTVNFSDNNLGLKKIATL